MAGLNNYPGGATWEVGLSQERAFLDIAAFSGRTDTNDGALES